MKYGSEQRNRRSIRLPGYDYAQSGAYFVTVCTQNRVCFFGAVIDGKVQLNDAGRIVQNTWSELPVRFAQVGIDSFIVMPNHIHGIIAVGAQLIAPLNAVPDTFGKLGIEAINRAPRLGDILRTYKALSARLIRQSVNPGFAWQRNYYEHIVRNGESLNRIRQYIIDNPIRWDSDRENPAAITPEPENAWRAR